MRIAVALSGTDQGVSGIGRFVGAVLPRIRERLRRCGGALCALGNVADLDGFEAELADSERIVLSSLWAKPGPSALWHLTAADRTARAAGADVLLFPAANRRFAWRSRLPTVAVVHDLAQFHVAGKYDGLRTFYAKRVLAPALRTASQIVAVSDATRRDLVRVVGCSESRVRVVHNGVDTSLFRADSCSDEAATIRRTHRIDRPYLLYACRLEHPGKNHLRLLRAFASSRLSQSHLLVLVGKDWGALPRIEGEIRRLELADAVRVTGFLGDEPLASLMRSAAAVLALGLYEGFGLPALEGLAVGRPVVASRTGAIPEVVGPLGVLCDPSCERSIRDALERAVDDDALRLRVAVEGPARARCWSWDATAAGLLEACEVAVA